MADAMMPETGVFPSGRHSAWATPNGMRGQVRIGAKVVRRLTGEDAWSEAVRVAGDLNAADQAKPVQEKPRNSG